MSSHNISGKDQARWSKALAKWPQLAKTLVNHRGAWEAVLRKQGLSMETSLRPALSASTAFFRANEGAKWRAELQQQKWPLVPSIQLPPEVIQDPATYNVALSLATEGIVLPLQGHFSFRTFAKRFGQKVRLDPQYSMELVSHVEDWNALYSKVLYSDLLQSWSYARAKETTGWKAKPYVFLKNQEPIALAHVLEKKKLGITVGRVNRGPLWIKPLSSTEDLSQIYALLRAKYSLFKSKVLVVAPHLLTQADHHLSLRELGFRRLKRHASWQSIWVDLQQPEESLRRALKSNWRCPLAAAEKKNLIFRKMDFAHRWPFFLDQYERFKKNKFSGIASSFLQAMGEEIEKNKDIEAHIYEVFQEDNPIVSALVIRHGRCATYLAVWAEEAARRVSASNFLVWNIMMNLKQEGCELFDFGGISDSSTEAQDIAAFKRGVGGLEYELVGEFCSL
ncbi:MAG: peptidoglycan bridge formation glycyltransferase FemA/FemB family protein [Gammaproteobacteria bacterium]|nr:peptidoglycan bridge formation glycyltransferase FemA/FemB family protein [Gammaproteobacteria bacterium]